MTTKVSDLKVGDVFTVEYEVTGGRDLRCVDVKKPGNPDHTIFQMRSNTVVHTVLPRPWKVGDKTRNGNTVVYVSKDNKLGVVELSRDNTIVIVNLSNLIRE